MDMMNISVKRCKVCNYPLNISKDNVYVAKVENVFFRTSEITVPQTVRIAVVRICCRKSMKEWQSSFLETAKGRIC